MSREFHYVLPEDVQSGTLILRQEECLHLVRVRRARTGDKLLAVNGRGSVFEAELVSIRPDEAVCRILSESAGDAEPLAQLTLAQGVMKGERFDWLVEKAVEIGVSEIIPMLCGESVVHPNPGRIERWRRIAVSAMKQSGRTVLPDIKPVRTFSEVVESGKSYAHRLMAHPGLHHNSLDGIHPVQAKQPMLALVGPEGGFTPEELDAARKNGFQFVSLGPRRLRAETAGLLLCSLILTRSGDLSGGNPRQA